MSNLDDKDIGIILVKSEFLEELYTQILLDKEKSAIAKCILMQLHLLSALRNMQEYKKYHKISLSVIMESFSESREEVCLAIQNDEHIPKMIYLSEEDVKKIINSEEVKKLKEAKKAKRK